MSRAHLKIVCSSMPPLRHTPADRDPGERYNAMKSDALKWLLGQPVALQALWEICKPYLVFDDATGTWMGKPADHAPNKPAAVEKRAGRPNKFDRDQIMGVIREVAPSWSHPKTLSEIHRVVAASVPINFTSFFNVIQRLVRDGLVIRIGEKKNGKLYYAAPRALEIEI